MKHREIWSFKLNHPWVIYSLLHDLYAMSCLFRVPGVFHKTHDHAPCRVPNGAHTQVSALCGVWGVLLSWAGKSQVLHWRQSPLVLAGPLHYRPSAETSFKTVAQHCWHLGLVEMSVWACRTFWWEEPLEVYSLFSRSLSALSAYHSGLITPMKIRTETPGNLRLYSGSPTRSEKEQVSISSFYYKERVSTRPKHCSQHFSFHDLFSFHLALLVAEGLYSFQKDFFFF